MPSKGSPRVTVRLGHDLHDRIVSQITASYFTTTAEPPDISQWIRKACLQRLDHLRRSKRRKPAAGTTPSLL